VQLAEARDLGGVRAVVVRARRLEDRRESLKALVGEEGSEALAHLP
jgi:hypothetical protein